MDTHSTGNTLQSIDANFLSGFFANLFARKQFTTHLLERNFNQPMGWLELGIAISLMVLTFLLSRYLWKKRFGPSEDKKRLLLHILHRMLWPLLLLITAVPALFIWTKLGHNAIWLHLLAMAARWMILIRLVLAVVNAALPETRISDWLERFLSGALWVAFLLWISGIDNLIIQSLQSVSFSVGAVNLNLYTVLTGLIWLSLFILLALWAAKFIEVKLMESERLDINLRIVLSKIVKTLMLVFGVLIALPLIGIDLTVLSVFGGALGVGIGFGLQKVASNYISGFIILGDRSIRPGDRLTVNDFTGYVTKITSRFVVLKNASGAEALIPNETFVTSTVINESYTSKSLWQSLNIQVAYKTDLPQALSLLEQAAAAQERVETSPAPKAVILNFGENGIDLRIGFWVKDPENGFAVLFSDIMFDIWQRFKENDIEFPFPQREVRVLNDSDNALTQTTKEQA